MPFDQRSLTHQEEWFPGGKGISKNPNYLKNGKKLSKMQTLKKV